MCRTIDMVRAGVNEIFPELPATLVTSGAIPVVGEVDADGWIKWFDDAPAELRNMAPKPPSNRGRRPANPTPDEIRWMCLEIRAERAQQNPTRRRKAVAHV